ncbi:hypothetical protein D9615_007446 [Tricholomella constricta]|uniref:Uncharacterized protein n=1 Tax=Tricholomella constricta TaxID=117010 RepID=A0A8H5GYC9_9AGAR|nr:hypothetical protein D9615_007446 [Tricholomella constricta]
MGNLGGTSASARSARGNWFDDATVEQRMAYMTMLTTAPDDDYNPALLEELKVNAMPDFEKATPDARNTDAVSEHASGNSSHDSTNQPSNGFSRILRSLSRFLRRARSSNIIKKS